MRFELAGESRVIEQRRCEQARAQARAQRLATLSIPGFILGESALSVLGLGIQEPDASWGNLLADAQNVQNIAQFPWILSPGVFIFLTIMSFNFLGEG